jgi:hypothetical protein
VTGTFRLVVNDEVDTSEGPGLFRALGGHHVQFATAGAGAGPRWRLRPPTAH